MYTTEEMLHLREQIKQHKPLIHCITNPISIHDCANVILAVGGRPIMAEHPGETAQITKSAGALVLNLGNITDVRMESMEKSLKAAKAEGIPTVLDLVGVACSDLRFDYAKRLSGTGGLSILKGNMSEIRKMAGLPAHSIGVDAGGEDRLTEKNKGSLLPAFQRLAAETRAVLLISGQEDVIVSQREAFAASNGTEMLSGITGTGCMLGALCGTCLSCGGALLSALLAVSLLGIAGEMAAGDCRGPGSFQPALLDALYRLSGEELRQRLRVRRLQEEGEKEVEEG